MSEALHVVKMGEAHEVLDKRPLVLLFGPDHLLREAAKHVRHRHPEVKLQLRATDNKLYAEADHIALNADVAGTVLIAGGAFDADFYNAITAAGKKCKVMTFEDGVLADYDQDAEKAKAAKSKEEEQAALGTLPEGQTIKLSNGTLVERGAALAKAASNMNMSGEMLDALDDDTKMTAIHAAYGVPYEPAAKPKKAAKAKE